MATILIVDDNPDLREVLSDVFTHAGFEVLTAADGITALHVVQREHPDVVLSDMDMPGMTGEQLCHAIRDQPMTCSVPLAILSGTLFHDDIRCREAGSCAVLLEPMPNKELVAVMQHLADQGHHEHTTAGCNVTVTARPHAGRRT